MLALLNFVPVAPKWLPCLDFERVAASLRHFSTCAWPDKNFLALPDLHLVSIGKHRYHFSTCACHPCAGTMLIFSVSFQRYRMTPERNPKVLTHRCAQGSLSVIWTEPTSTTTDRRPLLQKVRNSDSWDCVRIKPISYFLLFTLNLLSLLRSDN